MPLAAAAMANFPAVLRAQGKQPINAIVIGLGGRGSGAAENFLEAAKSLSAPLPQVSRRRAERLLVPARAGL